MKKLASRKNKTKQNKNKNLGACLVASENKKIGSIKIVLVSTGE